MMKYCPGQLVIAIVYCLLLNIQDICGQENLNKSKAQNTSIKYSIEAGYEAYNTDALEPDFIRRSQPNFSLWKGYHSSVRARLENYYAGVQIMKELYKNRIFAGGGFRICNTRGHYFKKEESTPHFYTVLESEENEMEFFRTKSITENRWMTGIPFQIQIYFSGARIIRLYMILSGEPQFVFYNKFNFEFEDPEMNVYEDDFQDAIESSDSFQFIGGAGMGIAVHPDGLPGISLEFPTVKGYFTNPSKELMNTHLSLGARLILTLNN